MLEQKLQEEVLRFKEINKYTKNLMLEQDAPPPPPPSGGDLGAGAPPPPPGGDLGAGVPPPPPPTGDIGMGVSDTTEEIDITDLVNMTKNIKKEIDDNKQDNTSVISKMDDVFTKLNDLEQKLAQMDSVMSKIDELGSKVESMKQPTPEEKLEMRSLDSYPFSQNPQQFFAQKSPEMKASGKNEYVLTKQDIQDYSVDTMKTSFNPEENEFKF